MKICPFSALSVQVLGRSGANMGPGPPWSLIVQLHNNKGGPLPQVSGM